MTKQEFIKQYCKLSGITDKEFSDFFIVLPCECNEEGCKGWAVVSNIPIAIKAYNDLYRNKISPNDTIQLVKPHIGY